MMIKIIAFLLVILPFGCDEKEVQGPTVYLPPLVEPPPLPAPQANFISLDEGESIALLDAQTLNPTEALDSFYIVGCNFFNEGNKELGTVESGINKGLNSISTERQLSKVVPVGRCIWRANQEDFGITSTEWKKIEANLTLPFVSQTIRNRTLQATLQKLKPWVFASDFFTTIYQADAITEDNGLFYDLTEQPDAVADFYDFLGINLQNQYDRQEVDCAGGDNSQIALKKHRILCIVDGTDNGLVMSTYDVDLADPDSVTENFATPEMALAGGFLRTNRIFDFAAQEHFYQLPNGLWQGRLNGNGLGLTETVAPATIVNDTKNNDLDPQIRVGACLNCHANEIALGFTDDVFEHAKRSVFNADEKNLVEAFFQPDRFQGKVNRINQEYRNSLQDIGVDPNAEDPLVNELIRPIRGELTLAKIASYLWMTVDEVEVCIRGSAESQLLFGNILNNGTISFADASRGFETLVDECGAFRDRGQLN